MAFIRIQLRTASVGDQRRRCGPTTLATAMTVLGVVATGCATARTDFRPYSPTSSRAPVLVQAVAASSSDLPALAAAGAVIVGTVTTRGNGFAGPDDLTEAAAEEAARHGGTHVIVGMTVQKTARGQRLQSSSGATLQGTAARAPYYPGRTLALTALVLRFPDDASWAALPAALRPQRDMLLRHDIARREARPRDPTVAAPAPSAPVADASRPVEASTPKSTAAVEPPVIDASHIKPLGPSDP